MQRNRAGKRVRFQVALSREEHLAISNAAKRLGIPMKRLIELAVEHQKRRRK